MFRQLSTGASAVQASQDARVRGRVNYPVGFGNSFEITGVSDIPMNHLNAE
jgi:hypothetical protein